MSVLDFYKLDRYLGTAGRVDYFLTRYLNQKIVFLFVLFKFALKSSHPPLIKEDDWATLVDINWILISNCIRKSY